VSAARREGAMDMARTALAIFEHEYPFGENVEAGGEDFVFGNTLRKKGPLKL